MLFLCFCMAAVDGQNPAPLGMVQFLSSWHIHGYSWIFTIRTERCATAEYGGSEGGRFLKNVWQACFPLYKYKYISTLHYGDTGSNQDILYLTQNLAFPWYRYPKQVLNLPSSANPVVDLHVWFNADWTTTTRKSGRFTYSRGIFTYSEHVSIHQMINWWFCCFLR